MNEVIFFIHILLVLGFVYGTLKLGKEALSAWVVLQAILANLFVLKQMSLFGLTVTCSDIYVIGSVLGLNLLQEYFGKEAAKTTTKICFYFMVFFAVMSQCHLLYFPALSDSTHGSYWKILSPAPRLLLASLTTFFLVQQFDIRFFAFLKKRLDKTSLTVRNFISLTVSQFLDTILFTFLGLYGYATALFDIILISFTVKVLLSLFLSFSMKRRAIHEV